MIYCTPEIAHLASDLHEHLVQMLLPLGELAQANRSINTDLTRDYRPEPIDPKPYTLIVNINAALMQKVFKIPLR